MRTHTAVFLLILAVAGCDRGKKVATPGPGGTIDAKAIEANNRGVGLMGQFEFGKAISVFDALLKDHPDWQEVRTNLAMGYLNRQQEGDSQHAMKLLEDVISKKT